MGKVLTKNLFQLSAESPISSETLDSVGITSGLRSKYVKKGLLLSLQKGVYMLPNSNIKWQNAVEFLQRQHPSIHIGGRSALALNGVVHNIPADAKIHLWGNGTVKQSPNGLVALLRSYTRQNPRSIPNTLSPWVCSAIWVSAFPNPKGPYLKFWTTSEYSIRWRSRKIYST